MTGGYEEMINKVLSANIFCRRMESGANGSSRRCSSLQKKEEKELNEEIYISGSRQLT